MPKQAIKAKKHLGQNFLIDETVLESIAAAVEIKNTDTIIEIGPGHGELTQKILSLKPKKVIAIEKDTELAPSLKDLIAQSGSRLEIIYGDALTVLPTLARTVLANSAYKVVGNIPYYITGYLMRILGELEHKPEMIVLMIQKEVAERICYKAPKMNLLSASVGFWGTAEIAGFVSKNAFNPRPKVDSAVIRIHPHKNDPKKSTAYYEAIKIIFKQPRKTILNNLKDAVKAEKISEESFKKIVAGRAEFMAKRGQDMNIKDLESFALYFSPKDFLLTK